MRALLLSIGILLCFALPASAQVSIGVGGPNVRININVPGYPQLVPVPGYPVYYAPQINANYFFYDGAYWVYDGDNWYVSTWYNGPWQIVYPDAVPLYLLRVPVRYYRRPPVYFRPWRADAAPHWNERWGNEWARRHTDWNHWNRNAAPAPAPLPSYQRQYSGNRYPDPGQQQALHGEHYRYQPRDPEVRQHYQEGRFQGAPAEHGNRQSARPPEQGNRPSNRPPEQGNRPANRPPEQGSRQSPGPAAQGAGDMQTGERSRYQQ